VEMRCTKGVVRTLVLEHLSLPTVWLVVSHTSLTPNEIFSFEKTCFCSLKHTPTQRSFQVLAIIHWSWWSTTRTVTWCRASAIKMWWEICLTKLAKWTLWLQMGDNQFDGNLHLGWDVCTQFQLPIPRYIILFPRSQWFVILFLLTLISFWCWPLLLEKKGKMSHANICISFLPK